jgi:aerobic carbon-monoxide dehydrogenase large subunit
MLVGKPVKRVEDPPLITGAAKFLDDMVLPGMVHAFFIRSPYPHAKIKRIDGSKALKKGAIAFYSGHDLGLGPLAVASVYDGSKVPDHLPLPLDKVRFVGEPVAVLVADDRYDLEDLAELVEIEYESLTPVMSVEEAVKDGAPLIHEELGSNICLRWKKSVGDVRKAFENAAHVTKAVFKIQRLAACAMEPRGAVASYDPSNGRVNIWLSTQTPHNHRSWIAQSLGITESRVRVLTPHIGGGFGSKLAHYPEDVVVPWLSMRLGRPVKWFESRAENLQATTHGRDMVAEMEAAIDHSLRITALRCRITADIGAYNYAYTQDNPVTAASMIVGAYKIPAVDLEVVEIFTNKMATDAYRGAGRPEAAYFIERLIDRISYEVGVDQIELRRRNFIERDMFPYRTPTGMEYDTGDYERTLRRMIELSGYEKLVEEVRKAREKRRLVGIGLSTFVEVCNFLYQSAYMRVEPSGEILVYTSTSPHGQGDVTAFTQIVADHLGVKMDKIRVFHGDTDTVPQGSGTAGSWTLTSGGHAILKAAEKIKAKMVEIAAAMLEVSPRDLEVTDGRFYVRDSPEKTVSFDEVAAASYSQDKMPEGLEMGLAATGFYRPSLTYPFGAYLAVVEVDPETYKVTPVKLFLVSDVGRIINPMLVEGQIIGGAVQAIGQTLLEEIIYSGDGPLLTSSFSDYLIPSAADVPKLVIDWTETPAPNDLGTKGVGELATIGLSQAIANAVEDALSHKVKVDKTPITSNNLYNIQACLRQPEGQPEP